MTNPTIPPHSPHPRKRPWRSAVALLTVVFLTLAACGSEPIPIAVPASGGESAAAPDAIDATAPVATSTSEFGDILVNADGLSVYGFTNDVDGISVCEDGCASAWPPILVENTAVPAGLDPAIFSVVPRADGTNQLRAGKWPLYLFAGDTAPGQTTGHLSGDVWFLATPDGKLIGVPDLEEPAAEEAPVEEPATEASAAAAIEAPALASAAPSELGDVLVNNAGLTLYGFTNDVDGVPTCEGGCAEAWPPVLIDDGVLPAELDPAVFSVTTRPDGTSQLKAGKWPLYLFAGDTAPGQTTGHLSGDVWFAVSPTGVLIDGPAAESVAEPAALVEVGTTELGDILVTEAGLSLYGFANDVDGVSTCAGGCADAWPPVLVPTGDLPAGLDASLFSVIARSDDTWQLKAGNWPLYQFAGDTAAGQTTGHLSGDVWFLAAPDGKLIDFAPATAAAQEPAAPAAPEPAPPAPAAAPTAVPAPTATPVPPAPTPTPAPAPGYGSGGGDTNSGGGSDY